LPQKQAMTRMVSKGLSTKSQLAAMASIQGVCLIWVLRDEGRGQGEIRREVACVVGAQSVRPPGHRAVTQAGEAIAIERNCLPAADLAFE
jgi:hypothetical protein